MATTNQNSAAPMFMGEFLHTIDGKNRLTIPSAWRFDEEIELFLMPHSTTRCLTVRTRAGIDRIREKADELGGNERTVFLRRIGAQTRQVTLDKNGRLSLPEEFCRQLKLNGEVKLIGAVETFEIWSASEWEAATTSPEPLVDSLLLQQGL